MVEGNIYEHVDTAHIARQYPPVEAPDVDYFQIPSYEVRQLNPRANTGA
jgi:hypothetical protein